MALVAILNRRDVESLAGYIAERYETIVADDDVVGMFLDLADNFDARFMGEHCLEARLRNRMRDRGYFERMLGDPELFDCHWVWNVIHWPWPNGFADVDYAVANGEPRYVRSRLSRALIDIRPVNITALSVARPPSDCRVKWSELLDGKPRVIPDSHGRRINAYKYAESHGLQCQVRKLDNEQMEVTFLCPANEQAHASSASEHTAPAAGSSISSEKRSGE